MKPSEATSTHAAFPQPQSSPVRCVLAAFHAHEFTHRDLHPDSPPRAGPSSFPGSFSSPSHTPRDIPIDPALLSSSPSSFSGAPTLVSPKRRLDPASNPDLFTPSKRMRLLGVGLASTSSGSFLVTKAKATHLELDRMGAPVFEGIPEQLRVPDWGLTKRSADLKNYSRSGLESYCESLEGEFGDARKLLRAYELISEGQNAQLVVQNLAMGKLKVALFEKEGSKKSDRRILFPGGKGRHLTAPEVIAQKREMENARKQEDDEREVKKAKREARKAEKARIEVEWKVMLAEHSAAVEAWVGRCAELKMAGTRAKDLPKKPKRPLKPKPKDSDDEEGEESDGDGSDED
ncbi:hypothetical protein GGX14DRAFT_380935 [Mycena pura]|uniref:Uncharacterized protein n=1 Tax=Mycena pura TaxID=153505 RepID=A0AAD6USZ3_9AGAR|nr:hypothetical protein GGX14DRAFT_380935 [Mycena pura]